MRGARVVAAGTQRRDAGVTAGRFFLRSLRFLAFCSLVFAATGLGFAWWFNAAYSDDLRAILDARPPVVRILDRQGRLIASHTQRQPHIAIGQLPAHLIDAVIATEDRRFFEHMGFDPAGLVRAFSRNLLSGRLREGGSTITQQLAKNIYLGRERTLTRKFRELVVAFWLEAHFDKRQILEYYLNRVYFGAGSSYGIEAAAQRYFGKSAKDLGLTEAAMLAGTLKGPSYYSPAKNLQRARDRASQVLDNMLATGAIDEVAAATARAWPAVIKMAAVRKPLAKGSEYAEDWIMDRLRETWGPAETDLVVTTTLDLALQKRAQKIVRATIETNSRARRVDQAALLVMDETGGVRAMVGGADHARSQFNRAVQARRQPGSAFKPFVYLAAMESGMTPDSLRRDEPVSIDGWRPRNASGHYMGEVSLRTALSLSLNSVAASLAKEVGLERVARTAQRLGIRSPLTHRAPLALGASEVTPLELTAAYVPMMNGGDGVDPHIIERIETTGGLHLYNHASGQRPQAIASAYIYDLNDMLAAVVRTGTGKEARLDGHPIAGKTGTSQDYRDAWFIGYSGHFTASVWMGNDNGEPTGRITGGSLPARLWSEIMRAAHEGLPSRPLPGLGADSGAAPTGNWSEPARPTENAIING